MTKEELIQFLKENLKVHIREKRNLYDESRCLIVELYIGDDCISSDYEYL